MTLAEIKDKKLTCVVHTKTKAEAKMLVEYMPQGDWSKNPLSYWDSYTEETGYYIEDGQMLQFSSVSFYKDEYPRYGEIYEFSDLFPVGFTAPYLDLSSLILPTNSREFEEKFNKELAEHFNAFPNDGISAKNGGKNSMKFTFYFNVDEGTRVDKSCNGTIPTVTTTVVLDKFGDSNRKNCYSLNGKATCDKADYNMRQGVLEALANAVFDGNFEKAYNKAVKTNEFCERKDRTCHYCGQLFDTIAEKEAHEAWHVERKKARRERYLLRKRAKEITFEEQAQKMAKEMIEK